MQNIKCDNCNKEFTLESKDIQTKPMDEVLATISFFECPKCNKKYITSCVDGYILKQQTKYHNLVKEKAMLIQETVRNKHLHITKYDKKIEAIDAKKLRVLEDMKRHSDMLSVKVKDRL